MCPQDGKVSATELGKSHRGLSGPTLSPKGTATATVGFMPEANRDYRTAPLLKVMLSAAIVVSAVSLAVAIVIAVFVDVQSDYLGARSEQTGSFDPSVFPPWNGALWLIGNMFPVLIAVLLVILIVARIVAGTRRDRRGSTLDEDLIVSTLRVRVS